MSVSIIIPVLNEYLALTQLLPHFIKQSETQDLELIICDGGSFDLTQHYVLQLKAQNPIVISYVSSELGRAKQMNEGARLAKYSQLLFLHADTQLPEDWFELIRDKQWGCFQVRLSGDKQVFRLIESMMNWRSCTSQVATGDQAIFVNKDLFEKIGGYPDEPLMEDIAISKLLRKNHLISCVKKPLVTSSRRWEQKGVFKTIFLMWKLRLMFFLGVSPKKLVKLYYPNYKSKRLEGVIQIFSKLPIIGFVKTRLIPQMGAESATNIHRYLLNHNLTMTEQLSFDNELWIAKDEENNSLSDDSINHQNIITQQGDNLGDRMGFAIKQGLSNNRKVVLIGTDCLDLSSKHVQQAFDALESFDLVFSPVEDGGFILIACRFFDDRLFDNVSWGTKTALADVISNVKQLSLSYHLLETLRDVDTYDDVQNYPKLMSLIN